MDAIKSIGEKLKLGRSKVAARKRKNEEEIAAEKQQIIVQVQQVQQQLPTDADQALVATVQACLVKYQRDDFAGGAVELKAVVASLGRGLRGNQALRVDAAPPPRRRRVRPPKF